MRIAIALLLLTAAAIHPLAHIAEDVVSCPCAHFAIAELPPPVSAGLRFLQRVAPSVPMVPPQAPFAAEIAPRGPPAA